MLLQSQPFVVAVKVTPSPVVGRSAKQGKTAQDSVHPPFSTKETLS